MELISIPRRKQLSNKKDPRLRVFFKELTEILKRCIIMIVTGVGNISPARARISVDLCLHRQWMTRIRAAILGNEKFDHHQLVRVAAGLRFFRQPTSSLREKILSSVTLLLCFVQGGFFIPSVQKEREKEKRSGRFF